MKRQRFQQAPRRLTQRCLISVAMIAKNEAPRLPAAVASARSFADEVVVADTGSTDDTPALARRLGCRVITIPWTHHFAAALNASTSACRGDYVFWQDPDEVVPPEDAPKLRQIAQDGRYDEVQCPTYLNSTYRPAEQELPGYGPGFVVLKPRMFRRCRDVRWRFRIHEDLHWSRAISRLDADVRVFNAGDAGHHGATGEDYYHALMILGLHEDPGEPHYALYLAEVALVKERDLVKARAYLAAADPERLGGAEQREKHWLMAARVEKTACILAMERGDAEVVRNAGEAAMAAFSQAQQVKGGSRAPLEAATLVLYAGQKDRFDQLVQAVRTNDPANLQALYLERLSALEPDAVKCNILVGTYLSQQRGSTPARAFATVTGATGKHAGPVRVRVVLPARLAGDVPLRARNLGACLGRLKALRERQPEGVEVEVVLVEQEGGEQLVTMAAEAGAEYAFYDDAGPFNRSACLNVGAEWSRDGGLVAVDPDDDGEPVSLPDLLVLMDGDLWVSDDWLTACLDWIAGWRRAGVWAGAMLPYQQARYLDADASERVAKGEAPTPGMGGVTYHSVGGALWIERELFERVGGFDAQYRGWGSEDRDFMRRLTEAMGAEPLRLPLPLWHLHHEEPDKSHAEANQQLLEGAQPAPAVVAS